MDLEFLEELRHRLVDVQSADGDRGDAAAQPVPFQGLELDLLPLDEALQLLPRPLCLRGPPHGGLDPGQLDRHVRADDEGRGVVHPDDRGPARHLSIPRS